MKSTLIILTRNEIEGVKAVFDQIPLKEFDECFAVDLNSTDGTVEFFKSKNIKVVPQEKKGRGEAFRIAARNSSGDILVFFSPDGNENPADAPRLAQAIKEGYDMAIASRFARGSKNDQSGSLFPYRAWANQFLTLLADICFGGRLTDSINGFRALRKDKFLALNPNAEGFAIEYQMSIRAMKLGYKIKEIPTEERERIGGKSGAGAFSVGSKLFRTLLKEIFLGKNFN